MPIFKISYSHATPNAAIRYVTRSDKAAYVSVHNLFEGVDLANQFADTMERFGKGTTRDERKYYHAKLSPKRGEVTDPLVMQAYAEEVAEALFPDAEYIVATHTDTETMHAHIVINAVDPVTGRKLHFDKLSTGANKDKANEIGRKYGLSEIDFRKPAERKVTQAERNVLMKGGASWKEELRLVIDRALEFAESEEEFEEFLLGYGVRIVRSGKDYSFLHPKKQKPIRGARLGKNYTKEHIDYVIRANNGDWDDAGLDADWGTAQECDGTAETDGQRDFEGGFGDVERDLQRLDRKAKLVAGKIDREGAMLLGEPRKGAGGEDGEYRGGPRGEGERGDPRVPEDYGERDGRGEEGGIGTYEGAGGGTRDEEGDRGNFKDKY